MFIILFKNTTDKTIFHYFCKVKKITKMKKIIVFAVTIIFGACLFSACEPQSKCPAYGHYSQIEQPVSEDGNNL